MIFLVLSGRMEFLLPENLIFFFFFFRLKMKGDLSQEYIEIWYFLYICINVANMTLPFFQKNQRKSTNWLRLFNSWSRTIDIWSNPHTFNSSSCIDLILTNQPNIVVDSGTQPSLHPNCYHQIIQCKINLKVEYLPPYQRHVWNYAKANKDVILSALQNVDWHRLFANKTVNQQVNLLNDIILNFFTNFVPNKVLRVMTEIRPGSMII